MRSLHGWQDAGVTPVVRCRERAQDDSTHLHPLPDPDRAAPQTAPAQVTG
ncbi:hypothetical protein ACIO93_10615 [Streptomyces sp. NPDC087903]